jgi:hypothetical protein
MHQPQDLSKNLRIAGRKDNTVCGKGNHGVRIRE